MKIFITGGAGFVGSHLADRLLAKGDRVYVIDNYSTGQRRNLTDHENLSIYEGSIENASVVSELINQIKPDVIVHAAASYKDPEAWIEDISTNVTGTVNVVHAAKESGCNRIIYFQTALCYGLHPAEQPITLNLANDPANSSYAISKTAGEDYIKISGIDFVSFRLANAYGPRNISGPLPTFYNRLTQDKPCFVMDTRRDFIYIQDLVDCVEKAVDGTGHGTFHISSGSDQSIKELFDATLNALDMAPMDVEIRPRNPDDAFSILLDPSETQKTFDWNVKTPLVDGVKAAIEYYKEFGIEQTYTHLKQEDTETENV